MISYLENSNIYYIDINIKWQFKICVIIFIFKLYQYETVDFKENRLCTKIPAFLRV